LEHAVDKRGVHIFGQLAQLAIGDADHKAIGVGVALAGNGGRIAIALHDDMVAIGQDARTSALPTYAPDHAVEPMIRQTKSSAMAAMNGAGSRRARASMIRSTNALFSIVVMAAPLNRDSRHSYDLECTLGQVLELFVA
jgi:hypothetical protein